MPSRGVRFTMVNGEEDDGVDSEHGTLLSYSVPASDGQPVALYAAGEGDGGPGALRGGPVGEGEGGPGALQGGPAGEGPSNFEKATAAATRGGRPLGGTGVLGAVARGVHVDVHACVEEDGAVAAVHQNAENFDAATEDSFKYLQVGLEAALHAVRRDEPYGICCFGGWFCFGIHGGRDCECWALCSPLRASMWF